MQKQEVVSNAAMATPSLASLVLVWLNEHGNAILTWASIGFIILQALYLLWKWRREAKGRK